MHPFVPTAYLLWPLVSVLVFKLVRSRATAAALVAFAGWALLPVQDFGVKPLGPFPWIYQGVALPMWELWTKSTVIGASLLLAAVMFDRNGFRKLRPHWLDAVVFVFALCPFVSAIWNDLPATDGLWNSTYVALSWGGPYLAGRLYFRQTDDLRRLSLTYVVTALACVPFCVAEWYFKPFIYRALYGISAYDQVGIERYIRYRPVLLMEDGNQLGMWMAGASVLAMWSAFVLWKSGATNRLHVTMAAVLTMTTLLCQSVGSIALMLAGFTALIFSSYVNIGKVLAVTLGISFVLIVLNAANILPLRSWAKTTGVGQSITRVLDGAGRGSLMWRASVELPHYQKAADRFVFGWGTWNWWEAGKLRPWGFWPLLWGMYGTIGLTAALLLILWPALCFFVSVPGSLWTSPAHGALAALAVLLLITSIDGQLNSALVMPVLLASAPLIANHRGSATIVSAVNTPVDSPAIIDNKLEIQAYINIFNESGPNESRK